MNEEIMTLEEIKSMYGKTIADECTMMKDGDVREYTIFHEVVIIRAIKPLYTEMIYLVKVENTVENALELQVQVEIDDEMEMDF